MAWPSSLNLGVRFYQWVSVSGKQTWQSPRATDRSLDARGANGPLPGSGGVLAHTCVMVEKLLDRGVRGAVCCKHPPQRLRRELPMTDPVRPPFPPRDEPVPDWQETQAPQPTQHDPIPLPPTPAPESRLGHYRLIRKLGQGGMGTVYLAQDEKLCRQVALKVPHFSDDRSHHALERFRREACAAARLEHPNICPIYEIGEDRGVHFFAMPFIDGKAISTYIQERRRLTPAQIATL